MQKQKQCQYTNIKALQLLFSTTQIDISFNCQIQFSEEIYNLKRKVYIDDNEGGEIKILGEQTLLAYRYSGIHPTGQYFNPIHGFRHYICNNRKKKWYILLFMNI